MSEKYELQLKASRQITWIGFFMLLVGLGAAVALKPDQKSLYFWLLIVVGSSAGLVAYGMIIWRQSVLHNWFKAGYWLGLHMFVAIGFLIGGVERGVFNFAMTIPCGVPWVLLAIGMLLLYVGAAKMTVYEPVQSNVCSLPAREGE